MPRPLLACTLALALALAPSRAEAGVIDDFVKALVIVVVVGAVVVGTVEVLTGVATYKNYRSASRHQDPAAGWVGVGAVGGLVNMGAGAITFVDGLPSSYTASCDSRPGEGTPTVRPDTCTFRMPANSGSIITGTLIFGFGAFALGSAIAAAGSGPDSSASRTTSPGSTPAVGLMLPALRF